MREKIILISVVFIFFSFNSSSVKAFGVNQYKLDFSVSPGGASTEILTIINSDSSASTYKLLLLGNYADWISFSEEEFTLQPGDMETITVVVSPAENTPYGNYNTKIGVLSEPITTGNSTVNTGIRIPVNIEVVPKEDTSPVFDMSNSVLQFSAASIIILLPISLFVAYQARKMNSRKQEEVMP